MRILQVTANYRPSVGGVERFVEVLAHGLAERGHEVTVLCCREQDAPLTEVDDGVRIRRVRASQVLKSRLGVPYPVPSPLSLGPALREALRPAEVVHVQDAMYATSVAALVAASARRRPSVVTLHTGFVPQRSRLLDGVERGALATLGRATRLANRVVAYNPAVAAWAKARWGLRDVALLPIGVPAPPSSTESAAAIRTCLGLPTDRFLALFVGRDVPTKRLDLFLEATSPAYHLVAVTDRPAPSAAAGMHVLPFMPAHALQRLYAAVDAFVLVSEAEGVPLSLQEALVAGLPCVLTHVPGFEHMLGEDEVLWVEPTQASVRDALTRLATDESLRLELAARAKAAGEREFGLERFVGAYEALYEDVLRQAVRSASD